MKRLICWWRGHNVDMIPLFKKLAEIMLQEPAGPLICNRCGKEVLLRK